MIDIVHIPNTTQSCNADKKLVIVVKLVAYEFYYNYT